MSNNDTSYGLYPKMWNNVRDSKNRSDRLYLKSNLDIRNNDTLRRSFDAENVTPRKYDKITNRAK